MGCLFVIASSSEVEFCHNTGLFKQVNKAAGIRKIIPEIERKLTQLKGRL